MIQSNMQKLKEDVFLHYKRHRNSFNNMVPYTLEKINGRQFRIEIGFKLEINVIMLVNHTLEIVNIILLGVTMPTIKNMEIQLGINLYSILQIKIKQKHLIIQEFNG